MDCNECKRLRGMNWRGEIPRCGKCQIAEHKKKEVKPMGTNHLGINTVSAIQIGTHVMNGFVVYSPAINGADEINYICKSESGAQALASVTGSDYMPVSEWLQS